MKELAIFVLSVAVLALLAGAATGQVPGKINYQVMLTDDMDQPLADQTVTAEFRLYDSELGGLLKWTETQNPTTNSVGVLSVTLGVNVSLTSALFDQPLWLEVEIDAETLTPRREVVAAPYALHASDSDELGGSPASYYVFGEDLFVPGVINTPTNPVDWTMLKNVPAGFADGADAEGGTGDGHSLDADDGSPVDAVYVNSIGNVGIGTTAPANKLTVGGSGAAAYAQFTSSGTGYTASDGFEIGVNGSGYAFVNQQEALSISFMTNGTLKAALTSDGIFEFGSSVSDGVAEFYAAGGASPSIYLNSNHGDGGELEVYEENGARYGYLEPDIDGTGGYLGITNGIGWDGFFVDGNSTAGNSVVGIYGNVSSMAFDTGTPGDDAVFLPEDAVSASEILDEPGCASNSATTMIELSGPIETLLSRSITVPADGYVLAIADAEVEIHQDAGLSAATFGVSNSSSSFPTGAGKYFRIPAGATQDTWMPGVSVHWLFPVSAGVNTFYFLGDLAFGTWRVWDKNLTLTYLPTSYGTVSATIPGVPEDPERRTGEPGRALTEADIAAERAESEAFNNARIERELAEMEAKIAELRTEMGNRNKQ